MQGIPSAIFLSSVNVVYLHFPQSLGICMFSSFMYLSAHVQVLNFCD